MNKKKLALGGALLFLVLFLTTGCGQKETLMDVPAADGNYHYSNKDLGFSLVLPPAFQYYQTQRIDKQDYVDIDFLVPTSDRSYQEYAEPIIVRAIKMESWKKIQANQSSSTVNSLVSPSDTVAGKSGDYVFVMKFWPAYPADWQQKWNDSMKQSLISGFKKL